MIRSLADGARPAAIAASGDLRASAGGTHDDWDEYDRVMAEQRRTAVFVEPTRVYGNG